MSLLPPGPRILLEDNASCHRSCRDIVCPFDRVEHGRYPSHSPDFNAIERLWVGTDSMVRKRLACLASVNDQRVYQRPYLARLIAKSFRNACELPAAAMALQWAWENVRFAANNDGRQRPGA